MERPDDLVALKEAAVLVGRSVSTLRAWIRGGELKSFREQPEDPNSRVLVSRQALLVLAAQSKPIHAGGPRPESAAPAAVPAEATEAPRSERRSDERRIEERLLLAALTAERDGLRAVIDAQKLTITTLEARCRDLENGAHSERLRAQEHQDRLVAAEAELQALRSRQKLPWDQRLLGGSSALPG